MNKTATTTLPERLEERRRFYDDLVPFTNRWLHVVVEVPADVDPDGTFRTTVLLKDVSFRGLIVRLTFKGGQEHFIPFERILRIEPQGTALAIYNRH